MNLTEFAIRRWQLTLVLFILLCALGYSAFRTIPRAVDPHFELPDRDHCSRPARCRCRRDGTDRCQADRGNCAGSGGCQRSCVVEHRWQYGHSYRIRLVGRSRPIFQRHRPRSDRSRDRVCLRNWRGSISRRCARPMRRFCSSHWFPTPQAGDGWTNMRAISAKPCRASPMSANLKYLRTARNPK